MINFIVRAEFTIEEETGYNPSNEDKNTCILNRKKTEKMLDIDIGSGYPDKY